jgi:hypothetical protein
MGGSNILGYAPLRMGRLLRLASGSCLGLTSICILISVICHVSHCLNGDTNEFDLIAYQVFSVFFIEVVAFPMECLAWPRLAPELRCYEVFATCPPWMKWIFNAIKADFLLRMLLFICFFVAIICQIVPVNQLLQAVPTFLTSFFLYCYWHSLMRFIAVWIRAGSHARL